MGVTGDLADFVVGTTAEAVPPSVLDRARLCALDWFGCALGGCRDPLVRAIAETAEALGGSDQATVVGWGGRTALTHAALINGAAANALDYDDMHVGLFGHPSGPVLAAALAVAEWEGATGADLLLAAVLGIDVACRLGNAVNPEHYYHGWHATGTLGHFGAAAACAKLMGLSAEQTRHALGLAGAQAAGIRQALGTMARPFHTGKAAANGILAALLAQRGFTGPGAVIEGPDGFMACFAPGWRPAAVTRDLGKTFEVDRVLFKRYAACYETHAAVAGVLRLRARHGLRPEQVESVTARVYPHTLQMAARENPENGLEAKLSLQYCTAAALAEGRVGEAEFRDAMVAREDLRALAARVRGVAEAAFPITQAAVTVRTTGGAEWTEAVDLQVEEDPAPLRAELRGKFQALAAPVLGAQGAARLEAALLQLDAEAGAASLMELAVPAAEA
jgi:2-methylcitrate dehydratase PrpD